MVPTNKKEIRWGIVGLGNIAGKFAQDMSLVHDSTLYAVASRSQAKAEEFGQTHDAKKAYGSYLELVQDPDVDAVYIATPHALHKSVSILCLEHGKAVLCEKPFAMNLTEVDTIIESAKRNRALLMEALWTRFLPHFTFALDTLQSKALGEIKSLQADFGFFREFNEQSRLFDKRMGGGSLLDIGIYPVFAALSTLGEPKEMNASATFFVNGADSSCSITCKYPNGVIASLESTLLTNTPTQAVFECERGTLTINSPFHGPTSVTIVEDGNKHEHMFECQSNGYSFEIEHFNGLLRDGKTESDLMPHSISRTLIKTLDTIRGLIDLSY